MKDKIDDDFINDYVLDENLKKKTFKIKDNLYIRFERNIKVFDFKMSYYNKVYYEKINKFDYVNFKIKDAIIKALNIKARILEEYKADFSKIINITPNKSNNQVFTRKLKRTKFFKIDKDIYKIKYVDKILKLRINEYLIIKITKRRKAFIFNFSKDNHYYNYSLGWFSPDFLYKDAMKKVDEIRKELNI